MKITLMRPLKKHLKVFVGIPFLGTGKECEQYLPRAIETIEAQKTNIEILPVYVTPGNGKGKQMELVAKKNNSIIDKFLDTDCTHLWLCNTDTEYPEDALERLIRLDVDISSGVSPLHGDWNNVTVGYELPRGGLKFYRRMDIEGRIVGENETVTTGNYCILAKRRVFLVYSEHHYPLRYRIRRERKYIYGTDLQFLMDAQDMGFSVRINGNVMCGHLPEWPLSYKGHEDTKFLRIREAKWQEVSV